MIFFFLQKVLFSHPDSYNIKKSDIREAPTLSTGAHSSNNTIKYLKTLLGTFTQFVALFLESCVSCAVCYLFHVRFHASYVTCHNNDHIHKLKKVKLCHCRPKLALHPLTRTCLTSWSGCFAMAQRDWHTDRQTDMATLWPTRPRG